MERTKLERPPSSRTRCEIHFAAQSRDLINLSPEVPRLRRIDQPLRRARDDALRDAFGLVKRRDQSFSASREAEFSRVSMKVLSSSSRSAPSFSQKSLVARSALERPWL